MMMSEILCHTGRNVMQVPRCALLAVLLLASSSQVPVECPNPTVNFDNLAQPTFFISGVETIYTTALHNQRAAQDVSRVKPTPASPCEMAAIIDSSYFEVLAL